MTKDNLFTIGHSIYDIKDFIDILHYHDIDVVVDVRSIPYSKFVPQYNKDSLKNDLQKNSIKYIYMGEVLGAKYSNKNLLFENNCVNFEKVRDTEEFKNGINRLKNGLLKGFNITLMCSEKEPFDCHRFCLISKYLYENGININHILSKEEIISQEDLEKKLTQKYKKKLPKQNLFNQEISDDKKRDLLYKFRNKDIGFVYKD
jgi:uncharacterized protein (DUF488 family)